MHKIFCNHYCLFWSFAYYFWTFKNEERVEDIYDNLKNPNDELKDWSKNLFAATVFVNYQEKARYPYIHIKRN